MRPRRHARTRARARGARKRFLDPHRADAGMPEFSIASERSEAPVYVRVLFSTSATGPLLRVLRCRSLSGTGSFR